MIRRILAIFLFFSLALPAAALKIEYDQTKENLSTGQYNYLSTLYLIDKKEKATLIYSLEKYDRYEEQDALFSIGGYYNWNKKIYTYLRTAYNADPRLVPGTILEGEFGYTIFKPLILVGNYRFQSYPERAIDVYSLGFDYYFNFPAWLLARHMIIHSSDSTHAVAGYLKLFYEFDSKLRAYLGYASGDEAYRIDTPEEIGGFNTLAALAGLQYRFWEGFGLKLDLAAEHRSNGIHNDIVNLGIFNEW